MSDSTHSYNLLAVFLLLTSIPQAGAQALKYQCHFPTTVLTCYTSVRDFACCEKPYNSHNFTHSINSCGRHDCEGGTVTVVNPITTLSTTTTWFTDTETTTWYDWRDRLTPSNSVRVTTIVTIVVPISIVGVVAVGIAISRCIHCRREQNRGDGEFERYSYTYTPQPRAVNSARRTDPSAPDVESANAPPPSYESVVGQYT